MPGEAAGAKANRVSQHLTSLDLCQWGPNRGQVAYSSLVQSVKDYFQKREPTGLVNNKH